MAKKRPVDFSLTFGMKQFGSWERAHAHTSAAACFDYLVCTPDGRVSVVYWAPLSRPFDPSADDPKRHRQEPPDKLAARNFLLGTELLDSLWHGARGLALRPGVVQYFDYSDPTFPEFFVRLSYLGKDRILRAQGYPNGIRSLQKATSHVVDLLMQNHVEEDFPADDPTDVLAAQYAQWRVDWDEEATDGNGRQVRPIDEVRKLGGATLR